MNETSIQRCTQEHLSLYGEIYAAAFAGEPWNDHWTVEDATTHVGEILESRQSYGLEYLVDGQVVAFILGSSMLFHHGRTFEINDLAVSPKYQGQGIASLLLDRLIDDLHKTSAEIANRYDIVCVETICTKVHRLVKMLKSILILYHQTVWVHW